MDELGSSLEHSPHFLCLPQGPGVGVGCCFVSGKHSHPSSGGVVALRSQGPHIFMSGPTLELFSVLQSLVWQS